MEENHKLQRTILTPKEAAEYLGYKVSYIYKLMMEKRIPYYKPFGNKCFIKKEELDRIIESSRVRTLEEIRESADVKLRQASASFLTNK